MKREISDSEAEWLVPQTFRQRGAEACRQPVWALVECIAGWTLGLAGLYLAGRWPFGPWGAGGPAVLVAVVGWGLASVGRVRWQWRRQRLALQVDAEGVHELFRGRRQTYPWSEVTSFEEAAEPEGPVFTLRTRKGSLTFDSTVHDWRELAALIRAQLGLVPRKASLPRPPTAEQVAAWLGMAPAELPATFHYEGTIGCGMVFLGFMGFLMAGVLGTVAVLEPDPVLRLCAFLLVPLAFLPFALLTVSRGLVHLLRGVGSCLQVEAKGLTEIEWWGRKRFLPWEEVFDLRETGDPRPSKQPRTSEWRVRGRRMDLILAPELMDQQRLVALIQRVLAARGPEAPRHPSPTGVPTAALSRAQSKPAPQPSAAALSPAAPPEGKKERLTAPVEQEEREQLAKNGPP